MIDINLTPAFITFEDSNGRKWKALALVAPLKTEDLDEVHLALVDDLDFKAVEFKVVRRD